MIKSKVTFSVLLTLLTTALATENVKRAPSGFQGVRGKKSVEDTYPGPDSGGELVASNLVPEPPSLLDKRAPSAGFHGMRGKKLIFPESEQLDTNVNTLWLLPKRAPMGFMGMRGKKEMEFVGDDFDPAKRAPSGFMGMRGKKYFDDEDLNSYNDFYMDKRAPAAGFFGMRGKKEYSPFMEEEKRAPADGFFGMRGKKQPGRASFFGMRGKKYPYEFRGKFVGVRGKKDSIENNYNNAIPDADLIADNYNNGYGYNMPAADLDLNELMVLLANSAQDGDAAAWEKRKGPSGFLGMRG